MKWWEGDCVVCRKRLMAESYGRGEVVAAVGPEVAVVCCARHLREDGPDGPNYREAVRLMALAKAFQIDAGG